MIKKLKIAFLWHMHQPFYVNPYSNTMELPWVRMHGLKSYYGMAKILDNLPNTKATFNLVPSLLTQLELYLQGKKDRFQLLFEKPAESLTPNEVQFITRHFFSANYKHSIKPYPRYNALFNKRKANKKKWTQHNEGIKGSKTWNVFTTDELRDLQIWFNLSWFDQLYKANHGQIKDLIQKNKHFSEKDKEIIIKAEQELLASIIPTYKKLAEKKQIEITTTPFYHPILPLLIDPQQGRTANPKLPKYRLNFNWKQDAKTQLQAALDYMQKTFGQKPVGIWPSEGSLSTETVQLLDQMGIKWTAGDQHILSKSLDTPFDRTPDNIIKSPDLLYKPYLLQNGNTRIFFRDTHLSNLVSFHYQKTDAREAAEDFIRQIKGIARVAENSGVTNEELIIPIIQDGENPWEHYDKDGREFLEQFFQLVESDPLLETVTFSECLDQKTSRLEYLSPGSWINGNFDIWIGHRDDRRAWRLVRDTRNILLENQHKLSKDEKQEAWKYLHITEGSDWFWWYGNDFYTADLDIFDNLFRANLMKIYELLKIEIPTDILVPVATPLRRLKGKNTLSDNSSQQRKIFNLEP